jgi:hypothetical protein
VFEAWKKMFRHMKNEPRINQLSTEITMAINKKLATAALAGLLSAGFMTAGVANANDHAAPKAEKSAGTEKAAEKNSCAGKNSCKGKGGCKTEKNACKGHNECKAKGGCATDGSKK